MPIRRSQVENVITSPTAITGLLYPANNAAGSDIRTLLTGAALPSRTTFSALWKKFESATPQVSYITDTFFSHNTGSFASDLFEVGYHGYPTATGTVDANGQSTDVTSQGGSVHYHEIAGLGGHDYLASPGGSSVRLIDGQWYRRAATIGPSGANTRHRYYFDLATGTSQLIEQTVATASIPAGGASAAWYWGTSDWRSGSGGAGTNDETPNGVQRAFVVVSGVELTAAQVAAISVLETDAQVLSWFAANGLLANLWFLNMNPTPSDITDKSGNGHDMTWPNANRPTLWTGFA